MCWKLATPNLKRPFLSITHGTQYLLVQDSMPAASFRFNLLLSKRWWAKMVPCRMKNQYLWTNLEVAKGLGKTESRIRGLYGSRLLRWGWVEIIVWLVICFWMRTHLKGSQFLGCLWLNNHTMNFQFWQIWPVPFRNSKTEFYFIRTHVDRSSWLKT